MRAPRLIRWSRGYPISFMKAAAYAAKARTRRANGTNARSERGITSPFHRAAFHSGLSCISPSATSCAVSLKRAEPSYIRLNRGFLINSFA